MPENELETIEQKITDYKNSHNLVEKSRQARQVWDEWFSPNKFKYFLEESLNNS